MARVVTQIIGLAVTIGAIALGGPILGAIVAIGVQFASAALLKPKGKPRAAAANTLQLGEVPRQALIGRAATAGSLVDVFNYGGKYGTDWEVMVVALADHRCDALEGFYVSDAYVAFAGDGPVAGYSGQLEVYWRSGTETQTVPSVLTSYGPGWTANDNGAGVAYVVVAYKADKSDAKNPVWPGGRPRFRWVVRGALCYDARLDTTVGGSGSHRWSDPATRAWSENPIVTRYAWVRGFYACDRVDDPGQLLVGRGLTAIEAPPANSFARANLCDELVDGEPRYRVGGVIDATEAYIEVEQDFAAACGGTISQPEGSVEIDPGEARAVVATFTDDDLIVGSRTKWNNRMLSSGSDEWVNSVVAAYTEPAQKWTDHAAPVRRDQADIIADGTPREQRLTLGLVTSGAQAGRIAEIARRFGRLHGRGEVTLPPRFCGIEEGDWVAWQSARRFGGATLTFRVDGWGSDEGWRHKLTLRQISASVFSDTDPLDDGSIAVQQTPPPSIGAPEAGSWVLTGSYQLAGGVRTPVLLLTGASDDPVARFVRFEYYRGVAAPDALTVWLDGGVAGPDVQLREIAVTADGTYWAAVSFIVDGVQGDRLILGPLEIATNGQLIQTGRWPELPASEPPVGSLYFDQDSVGYRFEGDTLLIDGEPITFGGEPLTAVPYVRLLPRPVEDASYQVEIAPPLPQTIYTDAAGAALPNQFPPRVLTPTVKRGGSDIRTSLDVSYRIELVNVTATIDNGATSPDKGRIIVTDAGIGSILLYVTIGTIEYGPFKTQFSKQAALPANAGGVGARAAEDSTFPVLNSTSYVVVAGPMTVTIGAGETIACTFVASYSVISTGGASFGMAARWEVSPTGAGTWTAASGSPIIGSDSEWFPADFSGNPGEGLFNQSFPGLSAGTYDVRCMGALTTSGPGRSLEIFDSTARVQVQ